MHPQDDNPHDDSRPRGVLTETDRRWLRGQKTYSQPPAESRRKTTVHDRIRNALYDFAVLLAHPEKIDRERLHGYTPSASPFIDDPEPLYEWAIETTIAFLLIDDINTHVVEDIENEIKSYHVEDLSETLESRIESVLNLAVKEARDPDWRSNPQPDTEYKANIDISIETHMHDAYQAGKLAAAISEGEIDPEDLFSMVESGEISATTASTALGWGEDELGPRPDEDN